MLFTSYDLKNLQLRNRIVMAPMCTYGAADGIGLNRHIIHYGTRAVGGAGLIIVEATGVTPEGRITQYDLGLYNDGQRDKLAQIAQAIKDGGAAAGIQLNHAGRKGKAGTLFAPSAIAYPGCLVPCAMDTENIISIVRAFKQAARRADEAGFDFLEIHGAHGYLINEFLSPLTNRRTDDYGGSEQRRLKFLFEVIRSVREVWPSGKALGLRISAEEYVEGGLSPSDYGRMLSPLKDIIDIVDVSSGSVIPANIHTFPGYQLPFADTVRLLSGIPVIGGGLINDAALADYALETGKCDAVYLGRKLLRDPYFPINAAAEKNITLYPEQYERAYR